MCISFFGFTKCLVIFATYIVAYCVLDIPTFSIGFVPERILGDFDVTHPDVNKEL